ncbi:MAG: alpha/beta hydrolase family protein [Verrucomicrobiales bacterium]|nr:alpha/beta hydrolase family protein [Verrucomicrobiales bacterium]
MKSRLLPDVIASTVLVLWPLDIEAQESAAQRHQMATNHLKRVASELSARCLRDVRTLDDWKQRRPELRRQLLEMLGLSPLPARTPLKAQITGTLERDAYRIEKLVFQSLPGLYVTGNFYVPKHSAKPAPTVLYLCGHAPHPRGAKFNYQDRAAWFATHGFACLILDTLEFGEVAGIHHGTHDLNMWHWLALGYTPAGTEVWNAMRGLDYLETRSEVDPRRIGITGISGGGAITWYTAAVDERVRAAAPVCSTFTFGSQASNWRAAGQCDCIYFHNTYGWEFPTVAALIAPRPLLMISGRKDLDFPPDGYHEVFLRSKKVYDLYAAGNSDRIREVDDDVGHSDPPQFLRAARQWMRRWLQNDSTPLDLETNAPPRETAEDLACLSQLPADAINYTIQNELTRPVSLKKPRSRTAWRQRRTDLLAQLDEKVFRWFPAEKIPFETRLLRNSGGWVSRYADYKDTSFQTEDGVRIRAQLLMPKERPTAASLLIYVKRPGDSIYFMDYDELLPLLGRCAVLILNPRFSELPVGAAEYASIEMTAVWSGRTIAAMQVWDILRAVEWAVTEERLAPSSISLYGKGPMGILALYAALRDPRIGQVILNDPPASHWQGPALLNVLRVTDIPEVAAAFAPRRLVSLTKLPETFEFTRAIYRLERTSTQCVRERSLPEALQAWKETPTRP